MIGLRNGPFIAIDFDGTVVRHDYPRVGADIGAVPWLHKWCEAGAQLILFTMRDQRELADAVEWFACNEVPLWGIQHNPSQFSWTSSVKPYAKLYLDDHGFGVPLVYPVYPKGRRPYVDWTIVGPAVLSELRGDS